MNRSSVPVKHAVKALSGFWNLSQIVITFVARVQPPHVRLIVAPKLSLKCTARERKKSVAGGYEKAGHKTRSIL